MNFRLYTYTILGVLSFGFQGSAAGNNPDADFEKGTMMDGMPMDEGMDDGMFMDDMLPAGPQDNKKPASKEPDIKDEKKSAPKDKDDFGLMNDAPKDMMQDKDQKKEMPLKSKRDEMNVPMDEMGKDMIPDASKAPNMDVRQAPQDQMPLDKGFDKMPEDDFGAMGDMDDGKGFDEFGAQAPMENFKEDFKDDFADMDGMDDFSKMDGDMMPPDMDDKMMDKDMQKDLMPAESKDMASMGANMDMGPRDMDSGMDDQIGKQPDNFKQ